MVYWSLYHYDVTEWIGNKEEKLGKELRDAVKRGSRNYYYIIRGIVSRKYILTIIDE